MRDCEKAILNCGGIKSIRMLCGEDISIELIEAVYASGRFEQIALCISQDILGRVNDALARHEGVRTQILAGDTQTPCDALYFDSKASYPVLKGYENISYLFGYIYCDMLPYFDLWECFRMCCQSIYIVRAGQKKKEALVWERRDCGVELSVVLPVYNVEGYLKECIESVTAWKAPYVEFLFVDDGSTDGSPDLIREYAGQDARIKLIQKKNGGCASARRMGLSNAKGRYVGFVDPDDFIEPSMFPKLLARALMGNYEIAYCGYHRFYEDTGTAEPVMDEPLGGIFADGTTDSNAINDLILYWRIAIWRAVYRRSFLEENKITFVKEFRRFDDLPFKIEVFINARSAVCVPEHLYYYRLGRPGQDVSYDDHRLYVHFKIFRYLDGVVNAKKRQKLTDDLQIIKMQTHFFALVRIQKKYAQKYMRLARKDLQSSCSVMRTFLLALTGMGKRAALQYLALLAGQQGILKNVAVMENKQQTGNEIKNPFFQPEFRMGYYVSYRRKRVWAAELDLLDKLLAVCREHDLKIFAYGGTMLGAVRHHGYIPWDDDIDLAMMREDYDRLLAIAPEAFREPYFFQTSYSDTDYPRGHAQLRNSNTTGMLVYERDASYHLGIFIDIFALDGVPEDPQEFAELERRHAYIQKKMWHIIHKVPLDDEPGFEIPKEVLEEDSVRGYMAYSEELMRGKSACQKVSNINFLFRTSCHAFPRSCFENDVWVDFENTRIPIPAEYDTCLTLMYGPDYMSPRQISTEHGDLIFEPDIPYKEFLKIYRGE